MKNTNTYNYLHLGLVQVALKPLMRKGMNISYLTYIRDKNSDFNDSLLGLMEASLSRGSLFFQCFCDFLVSLRDKNLLDVLTLRIQTSRCTIALGSDNKAVVYRIYYKAMTSMKLGIAYSHIVKNENTLFQTNLQNHIIKAKTVKWDEILLPNK